MTKKIVNAYPLPTLTLCTVNAWQALKEIKTSTTVIVIVRLLEKKMKIKLLARCFYHSSSV